MALSEVEELMPGFSFIKANLDPSSFFGGLSEMNGYSFESVDSEQSLGYQALFGSMGGLDLNLGNFHFRAFDNQTELDEYISHHEYGWSEERPGVCFGFSIKENEAKNKYHLELHFND